MPRAQVTHPDAFVMADGRVRIPGGSTVVTVSGITWTEFAPGRWEVETIDAPEPVWVEGDVVRDDDDEVFVRTPSGRWREVLGQLIEPVRPLRKLVPEQ